MMISSPALKILDLHDQFCPDGAECFCGNDAMIISIDTVTNYRLTDQFNAIQGESRIMFHGTFKENVSSIIFDGFKPELCADPSFGVGIYSTPCLRMASGFGGTDPLILMCRVKLGKCKMITEFDKDLVRDDQDSTHLIGTSEYLIYEANRVLPIAILRGAEWGDWGATLGGASLPP